MRYWVYINDKVDGPYDEEKLVTLDGFTPETLICSEEIEEGGSQEWVKASSIFEFDEASKTMTRAPLTQEELNTVRGNTIEKTASSIDTPVPAAYDAASTQILIDKIDNLTREIEGLKSKLDAALAANVARIPVAEQKEVSAITQPQEPVTEEALITNTESLVNHAEKLVAQASSSAGAKPVDFLDEIEIGASKTESLSEKGGEEVVLRSALDSLYNVKSQPEEEKEATFQDLLSAAKVITQPPFPTVEQTENKKEATPQEPAQPKPVEEPPQQAVSEEPEPAIENASQTMPAETEAEPEPAAPQIPPTQEKEPEAPLTEEKREEIINEITAPAQQSDLILQAIEEAQKEEEPALASLDQVPQTAEQQPVQDIAEKEEEAVSLPVSEETAEDKTNTFKEKLPTEKKPLDLTDQPQLNIVSEEPQAQTVPPQQQEEAFSVQSSASAELTPMDPTGEEGQQQKEVTETIKELVPGKKVGPEKTEDEGLISQADLEEAFTERAPAAEFPIPQENEPPVQQAQTSAAEGIQQPTESVPEGKGFYNPNDMTEVELKEGSTYLISDFIPPAQATGKNSPETAKEFGAVPGSAEAAQANAQAQQTVKVEAVTEAVEEIIPAKKDQTDLTMSKVILENTIKTKRGATMDIKTVPMVQEPAESERLDLSDSDLDINTQHDLKAADLQPSGNKLTKMILGSLVSIIILALIYVMLAYLEILPPQFNFINSSAQQQQMQMQDEQLNEMLGTDMNQQQPPLPMDGQIPGADPYALPQGTGQNAMPQTGMMPGDMQQQAMAQNGQMMPIAQPAANPLDPILAEVKNFPLSNGQTLQQLINMRHPAAQNLIEWNITTAVEPENYSILVKVPPENPQSFKISYRFNYNMVTKSLEPTISDSKNLLDSIQTAQAVR